MHKSVNFKECTFIRTSTFSNYQDKKSNYIYLTGTLIQLTIEEVASSFFSCIIERAYK